MQNGKSGSKFLKKKKFFGKTKKLLSQVVRVLKVHGFLLS